MIKKIIGWVLISAPFVAIFIFTVIKTSIWAAFGAFAIAGLIVACVVAGVNLTSD